MILANRIHFLIANTHNVILRRNDESIRDILGKPHQYINPDPPSKCNDACKQLNYLKVIAGITTSKEFHNFF